MLERLITFALSQRVFVLVFTGVLVAFGWVALTNLPIEAFPDVQDVQVQVVTQLPGLAPEEVERSVTLPIEREMSGVPRQTQLRSVSITGLSVVTMTFAEGTDDYFARQQVLEKLGNVTLPAGVQPQLAPLSTAVGEVYRYVLNAPADMPIYEVRAIQDWTVKPALRIVSGIADVISFGGSVKEYQVRVNPFALKRFGVTLDQVSKALASNSANVGGGLLRRGDEALVVRGVGLYTSVADIARTIVSSDNGKPIFVSDIAEVSINGRVRSGIVAWNDRDDVVQGIAVMIKGQNATKVVKRLREKVDEVNEKLPPGVRIVPTYQRSDLVEHTVMTVIENLAVAPLPDHWSGPRRQVGTEELMVAAPPGHRVALLTSVDMAELADEPWVHFVPEHGLAGVLDHLARTHGFRARSAMRTSQTAAAPRYVAAGVGLAILPANLIGPGCVAVHLEPPVTRDVFVVTRPDPDGLTAAFVDTVARELPVGL